METYRGGAWNTIASGEVFSQGSWRPLQYGESFKGGVWQRIFTFVAPFSITVSPTSVSASGRGNVTTPNFTATPTGGLGPFTYSWTFPGYGFTASFTAPSAATTAVQSYLSNPGTTSINASVLCTAADSIGNTATDGGSFLLSYL